MPRHAAPCHWPIVPRQKTLSHLLFKITAIPPRYGYATPPRYWGSAFSRFLSFAESPTDRGKQRPTSFALAIWAWINTAGSVTSPETAAMPCCRRLQPLHDFVPRQQREYRVLSRQRQSGYRLGHSRLTPPVPIKNDARCSLAALHTGLAAVPVAAPMQNGPTATSAVAPR